MTEDVLRIGNPPSAPPAPPAPFRSWWLLPVVALAVVLLAGTAGIVWYLQRPGVVAPGTFNITGKLTIAPSGVSYTGPRCRGTGGYEDMHPGATVVVTDASGTTVALGQLQEGTGRSNGCEMPFEVLKVPSGHDFYGITIGNRKGQQYSAEDVRKPLSLSLG